MGDRGQVFIADEGIYLYTHWGATELIDLVRVSLAKRDRWDDPEYLARIIFCAMIKGDEDGTTGYGIGTTKHGDIWRLITINCKMGKIWINDNDEINSYTFEEFIKATKEK